MIAETNMAENVATAGEESDHDKLTFTVTSTVIDVNPLSLQISDSCKSNELVPVALARTWDWTSKESCKGRGKRCRPSSVR